ncbi:MAG TPA: HAD-IIIC family phosphatase [Terracidiphilus sp.]|nr:HAD-IIIC family phosphatase [Terracidiphilus sp.]
MKLLEALDIVKGMNGREGRALPAYLATGFTSLHLKTFLTAELSKLLPDRTIEVSEGLFGDLLGNLRRFSKSEFEFGAVFLEWCDLDSRLGIRSAARWNSSDLDDILATTQRRAQELQQQLNENSLKSPIALSLPTLPLVPFSYTPGWQASSFDLELHGIVRSMTSAVSHNTRIRVLNSQRIDIESPLKERFDVEGETLTGFPYRLPHASSLAFSVARLLQAPLPKKGLITDLDETLWKGTLGEDGVDGIRWDLEHKSQMHAFYQRFLGSLASAGVMVGVASKNDPALVNEAMNREDLAISQSSFYPIEAHWEPKSHSVTRIMEAWNVSDDSIVFVDDSPFELAEVKAAHPDVHCLQFPTGDPVGVYNLVQKLRDIFGKGTIFPEDAVRVESIRRRNLHRSMRSMSAPQDFIEDGDAELTCNFEKFPPDLRALELVNKTNQFNLNGRRYTESSWLKLVGESSAFLMIASYRDKFGPLGKIAVLGGSLQSGKLNISVWAMSCRAFSRRIEYKCLYELVKHFGAKQIAFDFQTTQRNGPIRDFLCGILGTAPSTECTVTREILQQRLESFLRLPEPVNERR